MKVTITSSTLFPFALFGKCRKGCYSEISGVNFYLATVAEWIDHQTTNSWSGVRTQPGVTSKVVLEILQTGLETSC